MEHLSKFMRPVIFCIGLVSLIGPFIIADHSWAAPKSETHRRIDAKFFEDEGRTVKTADNKVWRLHTKINLVGEFPIKGGQVSGKASYYSEACPLTCFRLKMRGTFSGTYDGKDGGVLQIKIRWVDQDDGTVQHEVLTGNVYAKGTGFLVDEDNERLTFSFPPFALACNLNLNEYEQKLAEEIRNKLIDLASEEMVKRFVQAGTAVDKRVVRFLTTSKSLSVPTRVNSLLARGEVKSMLTKAEGGLLSRFETISGSASKLFVVMDAMVAASVDDHWKVAEVFAWDAATLLFPPASTYLVPLMQAAKSDFDLYLKRRYGEQFRKMYHELYFDDGRPNAKKGSDDRKLRLRQFVNDVLLYFDAGFRLGRGGEIRSMLKYFAKDELNLTITNDDLKIIDTDRGPRFKSGEVYSVIGALFRAYERIYVKDREAELLRRAAKHQAKAIKEAAKDSEWALSAASRDDFSLVWAAEATRKRIMCNVINTTQKAYLAKN